MLKNKLYANVCIDMDIGVPLWWDFQNFDNFDSESHLADFVKGGWEFFGYPTIYLIFKGGSPSRDMAFPSTLYIRVKYSKHTSKT